MKVELGEPKGVDPISVDEFVAAGVRFHLDGLRTSGRIYMAHQDAQDLYDIVAGLVGTFEGALGEELPAAREALASVAADPWAGVTAAS